jgi:hypothetical protein
MWEFVAFILVLAYIAYNGLQVLAAMNGKRYESVPLLFFLAAPYDFYFWLKDKIGF